MDQPDGTIAKFHKKLRRKKEPRKAMVAVSTKMLRIICRVLKERRPCVPGRWH